MMPKETRRSRGQRPWFRFAPAQAAMSGSRAWRTGAVQCVSCHPSSVIESSQLLTLKYRRAYTRPCPRFSCADLSCFADPTPVAPNPQPEDVRIETCMDRSQSQAASGDTHGLTRPHLSDPAAVSSNAPTPVTRRPGSPGLAFTSTVPFFQRCNSPEINTKSLLLAPARESSLHRHAIVKSERSG